MRGTRALGRRDLALRRLAHRVLSSSARGVGARRAEKRIDSMNKKILAGAALAVFVMQANAAHATDDLQFPGSSCVQYGTGSKSYSYSAINNASSTYSLELDCPVVRDQTGHTIASGSWVRVIDQHYSEDVRRELTSIQFSGVSSISGWGSGMEYSSGSNTAVQVLSFGAVGSNSLSHYYLSCEIPPSFSGNRSYITSYRVVENN
jgi:hypothetical protein